MSGPMDHAERHGAMERALPRLRAEVRARGRRRLLRRRAVIGLASLAGGAAAVGGVGLAVLAVLATNRIDPRSPDHVDVAVGPVGPVDPIGPGGTAMADSGGAEAGLASLDVGDDAGVDHGLDVGLDVGDDDGGENGWAWLGLRPERPSFNFRVVRQRVDPASVSLSDEELLAMLREAGHEPGLVVLPDEAYVVNVPVIRLATDR